MVLTLYKDSVQTPGDDNKDDEDDKDGDNDMKIKNKSEDDEEVIEYKHSKQTMRDEQLMKRNQVFRYEIAMLYQKMAKCKKNQIISQIEEKRKA